MPATTFMGLPVEGDVSHNSRTTVQQRPLEELTPLLQALLDDPFISRIVWLQYTPHFSDGDPCEFSVNEPGFVTVEDEKALDSEDEYVSPYSYEVGSSHPTLGGAGFRWSDLTKQYVDSPYQAAEGQERHEETYERCRELVKAVCSGAFDDVLSNAFGDHAKVTITRTGVQVEEYEHD